MSEKLARREREREREKKEREKTRAFASFFSLSTLLSFLFLPFFLLEFPFPTLQQLL